MIPDIKTLTIVRSDGLVAINGVSAIGLNMDSIPENYHAVQWYGTWGEIEFNHAPGEPKPPNERIDTIAPYQTVIEEWDQAVNPPPPPPPPPPPEPTPEEITTMTMYQAQSSLSAAAIFGVEPVKSNITPDSQYALQEWVNTVTEILTKAQKILIDGTGEAYAPTFPPHPTLNPAPKAGMGFTVYFSEPPKKG